jgi:hypothetical protein
MKSVLSPRKKIALVIVIAVAVIIVVSMFPYKHFLAPEPSITMKTGNSVLPIVGDFNSTYNYSDNCISFNSTEVSTTIYDKGYNNSFLNFTVGGFLDWLRPPEGGYPGNNKSGSVHLHMAFNISGYLAPNLDPEKIALSEHVKSPKGLGYLYQSSFALLPEDNIVKFINTSNANYIGVTGSTDNFTCNFGINLDNKPVWSLFHGYGKEFYSFTFSNNFVLFLQSYTGTHYFRFSVSLPGLRETPYANITVETVYRRS